MFSKNKGAGDQIKRKGLYQISNKSTIKWISSGMSAESIEGPSEGPEDDRCGRPRQIAEAQSRLQRQF